MKKSFLWKQGTEESLNGAKHKDTKSLEDRENLENKVFLSGLEKIESNNDSEEEITQKFLTNKDPGLLKTLIELRKSSELIIKKFSAEVITLFKSNKLAVKLRTIYIGTRALQTEKNINKENKNSDLDNYQQFLKLLRSDFWGNEKNPEYDCYWKSRNAINSIGEHLPELSKEVLITWPKLFSKANFPFSDNKHWQGELNKDINKKLKQADSKRLNLSEIDDNFLALNYLKYEKQCFNDMESKKFADLIFERFDNIIEEHPNIKVFPEEVFDIVFSVAKEYPEEIMLNRKRQQFLFDLWFKVLENNNYGRSSLLQSIPIFVECLKNCSDEDKKNIEEVILEKWSNTGSDDNFRWLINLLSVSNQDIKNNKKNLKKAKSKIEDIEYWSQFKFRQGSLKKSRSSEQEGQELLEIAEKSRKKESVVFLTYLIINYPQKEKALDSPAIENIVDSFFSNSEESFDIEQLKSLTILMNLYNWPDSLKKKVFKNNKLGGFDLNRVITKDSDEFIWIKEEPFLLKQLELDFYQKARDNDLRHHFYNVLDGKHQADDFDALIKSYVNTKAHFDIDEIINLFITRQVDKVYLPLFIEKFSSTLFLRGLGFAVSNGVITPQDRIMFLENLISHGNVENLAFVFKKLEKEDWLNDQDKKIETLNSFSNNILEKLEKKHKNNDPSLVDEIFDKDFSETLSLEEKRIFYKNIFEGLLNMSNLGSATILFIGDLKLINEIYLEKEERKIYLKKVLDKLFLEINDGNQANFSSSLDNSNNNNNSSYLISSYFSNPDFFKILEKNYLNEIEKNIFDSEIGVNTTVLLRSFENMDSSQKKLFLRNFEENYLVNEEVLENRDLTRIISTINNLDFFNKNKELGLLIFKKLLNDPNIASNEVNRLLNKEIFLNNKDIIDVFLKNVNRWPDINGEFILGIMESEEHMGKSNLSIDEVKKISTITIEGKGLSQSFWKKYLSSDKDAPAYFLDEALFKIGIKKIDENISGLREPEIIYFLKSLESSEFKLENKDKVKIISKILEKNPYSKMIECFYNYNKEALEEALEVNDYHNFEYILRTRLIFSDNFNNKMIEHAFKNNFFITSLDEICKYFKFSNNQEIIQEIKEQAYKLYSEESSEAEKIFLKNDLLSVAEVKKLYKKSINLSDNIRENIINSIELIGSMLSNSENAEKLKDFFDDPQPEDVENIKRVSEFIKKYNKEDKGRSIVVMLFARQYLPDRSLEDVIKKVAGYLDKYEKVLGQYSYKNIPEGLKSSIGMEYEITSSTANGYRELTSQDLKKDITRLSEAARIGVGFDAVHEIATRPTDNPYLMLLEMKLLHDIEYIDFNFDRSQEYQKGARGFHLTIGGEEGLRVEQNTQFLQNVLIASSWGGVQSGETGGRANGGRGVSLRNRSAGTGNNVPFFGKETDSVELRSLSVDKEETLQRAVTTAFHGAIAIQAFNKCISEPPAKILELLDLPNGQKEIEDKIFSSNEDEKTKIIAKSWMSLVQQVDKIVRKHNDSFLDRETTGYLDDFGIWIDNRDFGGEGNKKRFEEIIENMDQTLSIEEYVNTTNIERKELFSEFNIGFSDKLTKINNLYLKPGTRSINKKGEVSSIFKGDNVNALSALETTKLEGGELESYDKEFLRNSIFDMYGEKRNGYYCFQGGSEEMLTHAVQKALIKFNLELEKVLN